METIVILIALVGVILILLSIFSGPRGGPNNDDY